MALFYEIKYLGRNSLNLWNNLASKMITIIMMMIMLISQLRKPKLIAYRVTEIILCNVNLLGSFKNHQWIFRNTHDISSQFKKFS